MNFDRFRIQQEIENKIGCRSPKEFKDKTKRSDFKRKIEKIYIDDNSEKVVLLGLLLEDSKDIYFKAFYSLSEAIDNLSRGRFSWSIVKIYYSIFYFIRCSLASDGYALFKCGGDNYCLKLDIGESPSALKKKSGEGAGDHYVIVNKYMELMEDKDILLTNNIAIDDEEVNVYRWIRNMREIVNYKERTFFEPINKYFASINSKEDMLRFINLYIEDDVPVYPFQEKHCLLSTSVKLLIQVTSKLIKFMKEIKDQDSLLTLSQEDEIRKILEPIGLYDKLISFTK